MTLRVIGGKVRPEGEFEKRRVSFLGIRSDGSLQMISGKLMVKRREQAGMPPRFFGPLAAGWENIKAMYPEETADLHMLGALIATPEGEFRGLIDWVTDVTPKVIDHETDTPIVAH